MDEDTLRYRETLLGEIHAEGLAEGDYSRTRFIDRACSLLESAEELTEYHLCRAHTVSAKGGLVQVDAYSFSPSDGVVNLIIAEWSGVDFPEPIMTEEARRLVQGAYRFLEGSVHDRLSDRWDESSDAHSFSRELFAFATGEEFSKVYIYLVSDRPLGAQTSKTFDLRLGTAEIEVQLWDITRMARVEASSKGREDIRIDFLSEYGRGVPALAAGSDPDGRYTSYMCVIPGGVLAGLYDRFGGRILEQNVRAFLGEGRKVNKGIRETLRTQPEMFFAFNNGLTATAAEIELARTEDGATEIVAATGLQVVNGGQTTASLFWAHKAGVDLSKVQVQMKLSRLAEEGFDDAVHNIARYANAQNAVSASDLFAGHPYFKRLETQSRETLATGGASGLGGYWYFERTTGGYRVEQRRRTGTALKVWQTLNPKSQLLTKTDVARYEMTFACQPHLVSAGAQKNIAAFGKTITQLWDQNPENFDAGYFRRIVGRAILTRALDALIPKQPWYGGSILRPLSTYTLALMSRRMRELSMEPDYEAIWRSQRAAPEFMDEALRLAELVQPLLQDIPPEQVRNRLITEWVKRESCWTRVEASPLQLDIAFVRTLLSAAAPEKGAAPWHIRAQQLWREGKWKKLRAWNEVEQVLTPDEADLVNWASVATPFSPKGFKLTKLREGYERALINGFA
ncbi:AIPR family protein [Luteimonas sp. SMYT11W]|uniref:AIPR family protein n=1 Tax=Luteimonas flava TaxID=3115822 RepID=A0ABU7WHT6_9GAMM